MAVTTYPVLDALRIAYTGTSNPALRVGYGDLIGTWNLAITPIHDILEATLNLANGQLLIGSTSAGRPVKATLTAGSGISVINTSGTITVAALGGLQNGTTFPVSPNNNDLFYRHGKEIFSYNNSLALWLGTTENIVPFSLANASTVYLVSANITDALEISRPHKNEPIYVGRLEMSFNIATTFTALDYWRVGIYVVNSGGGFAAVGSIPLYESGFLANTNYLISLPVGITYQPNDAYLYYVNLVKEGSPGNLHIASLNFFYRLVGS